MVWLLALYSCLEVEIEVFKEHNSVQSRKETQLMNIKGRDLEQQSDERAKLEVEVGSLKIRDVAATFNSRFAANSRQ